MCYSCTMLISRKGELLWKILSTIGNATIAFSSHPSRNSLSVYRALRDFTALQAASDSQLRTISKYIVDKKYVIIERAANGASTIAVSEAGKTVLDRAALMSLRPKAQKKWDKMWRLVMFDIPTHSKASRDKFAGTLKVLGFVRYQKSVFICPHPCEEELEALAEYLGVSDYVDIVLATKINREEEYRKEFKLR